MGAVEDAIDLRTHAVFTFTGSAVSDEQNLHRSSVYAIDMPAGFGTSITILSSLTKGGTKKAIRAGLVLTVVADAINPITDSAEAMSLASLTYCTLTLSGSQTGVVKVGLRRASQDS